MQLQNVKKILRNFESYKININKWNYVFSTGLYCTLNIMIHKSNEIFITTAWNHFELSSLPTFKAQFKFYHIFSFSIVFLKAKFLVFT